eukprot:TRINITY_DN1607_c0_g2_i1.p1 TRINITY_DN1607_c0_g2~~TRINITY_DN1607_c0_g2_i1.p1  ORF type:complete len:515 (-),score=323.84 TRINITY_DN1607_c0_g2_i1:45-1589(-)
MQLEIEEISLKKEKGDANKERLEKVRDEMKSIDAQLGPLMEQYERERGRVVEIAETKRKIEELAIKADRFKRERKLEQAADLLNFAIPDCKMRLARLEAEQRQIDAANATDQPGERIVQHLVTPDVVAGVVSRWTGVPVQRLLATEAQQLLNLEATLGKAVVGQPRAVKTVSQAVLRSRAGLADPDKPTGVFMFFGCSGTGKTLLAKTLASQLFDSNKGSFLRIDMSEYKEEHATARLIGAPPGYVGYDEAGQLTEHLRRRSFSVVLFDEIEKAHPKVADLLLQLFDEGRITDSHGRTADGRNAVFIVTSNLGAAGLLAAQKLPDAELRAKASRKAVFDAARAQLRPEFLNRIDELVVFDPLSIDAVEAIVRLEATQIGARLAEKGVTLELADDAVRFVAQTAYSPSYGARPLKRWLEKHVTTELATRLLDGRVAENSHVRVTTQIDEELRAAQLAVLSDDEFFADDELGDGGVGSGGRGSEGVRLFFEVVAAPPQPGKRRKVDSGENDIEMMD